jgi:hypothetical protein
MIIRIEYYLVSMFPHGPVSTHHIEQSESSFALKDIETRQNQAHPLLSAN